MITKKEKGVRMTEFYSEDDFFKIQSVNKHDLKELQAVITYSNILRKFIETIVTRKIKEPPIKTVKVITQTIIALIMEVTGLPKSSYTEEYEEMYQSLEFLKPHKTS
jgi:DNA-binding transcriptional regulator GbsR (MarR family)